jgi:3'(2'), 5'-bisphosphate nucleotidase
MYSLPLTVKNPLLSELCRIAAGAGEIIMGYYRTGTAVERKDDDSPVTEADRKADDFIASELRTLLPHVPVVSEEGTQDPVAGEPYFWLVDPLDGTKSFIKGGKNWTVNIGMIHKNRPVLGVILAPVHRVMYVGELGAGAFRIHEGKPAEVIRTRTIPDQGASVILSHHHASEEANELVGGVMIFERVASASSIKFCKVAEGTADIYPRKGPTMEWDTAAGQAIVEAAGGRMVNAAGRPFMYGKPDFLNGPFTVYGAD